MNALATLAAASVLALVGAAAVAQQAAPPAAQPGQGTAQGTTSPGATPAPDARGGLTRADRDALTDARMAGIPAGLKLTDEQRRLWTPVEQALRAQLSERAERMEERRQRMEERRQGGQQRPQRDGGDFMERVERQAAMASERAEHLRTLSAAMKPFWASLDENQKRLLPRLIRQGREGREGHYRHHDIHRMHGGPRQP